MPRTRESIESELAACHRLTLKLKAELAATQPLELEVSATYCGGSVTFDAGPSSGNLRICVHRGPGQPFAGTQIAKTDVPAIRAWLDYHYPKDAS